MTCDSLRFDNPCRGDLQITRFAEDEKSPCSRKAAGGFWL